MKPATAVLKNGVVLQDFATGAAYTNKNLTDEFAIEYLKKYPTQSKLFAVLPKVVAGQAEGGEERMIRQGWWRPSRKAAKKE